MRFGRIDAEVEAFVRARYPALVRTAYLVCTDPDRASRLAISSLADVTAAGPRALAEGTPTADAWSGLLTALLATAAAPAHPPLDPGPGDVPGSLAEAYAALPVLARVALAANHVEGLSTAECASATGRPPRQVDEEVAAAMASLHDVHDRTRAAAGLDPAPHLLAADLEGMLRRRADQALFDPDPVPALHRERSARRRRVGGRLAAGLAVLALLSVVVALSGRTGADGSGPRASPPTTPRVPISQWSPRGELAGEPTMPGIVDYWWGAQAHLLFAGDIGTTRLVIGWRPASSPDLLQITALSGPASGAGLSPFAELDRPASQTSLALTGPAEGGRTPLLVLQAPGSGETRLSSRVSYRADGTVSRSWSSLATRNGVAFALLPGTDLPALRVRVAGRDGPPDNGVTGYAENVQTLCPTCSAPEWRAAVATWAARRLAAATLVPATRIAATVQVAGPDPAPSHVTGAESTDLACIHEHLPDGSLVQVTAARRPQSAGRMSMIQLSVIPVQGAQQRPCVMPMEQSLTHTERYVVAVPGARGVRIADSASDLLDPAGFTAAPDGVAVLTPPADSGAGLAVVSEQGLGGVEVWSFSDLRTVVDPFDERPAG